MKRFILGFISCSILIGCGRQNLSSILPLNENIYAQNTTGNQVSIQSEQGMKNFYHTLVTHVFNLADMNNDRSINYEEFKSFYVYVGNGSIGIISNPNQPVPVPSATPNPYPIPSATPITSSKNLSAIAKDTIQNFLKVDKNKDGKITHAEAQASIYFLGVNQKLLREGFTKYEFNHVDQNKNNSVSLEEFKYYISIYDLNIQNALMALYFASDKNFDNKLGFSEFEDLLYSFVKAGWEQYDNPGPVPSTTPAPPNGSSTPCSDPNSCHPTVGPTAPTSDYNL